MLESIVSSLDGSSEQRQCQSIFTIEPTQDCCADAFYMYTLH